MTTARPTGGLAAIVYTLPIGSLFLREWDDDDGRDRDDGDVHFVCNGMREPATLSVALRKRERHRVRRARAHVRSRARPADALQAASLPT